MTTATITKKIKKIEQELKNLKQPKSVLGKLHIDSKTVTKAKKALFDFDIEKFISKKDLKTWKK